MHHLITVCLLRRSQKFYLRSAIAFPFLLIM